MLNYKVGFFAALLLSFLICPPRLKADEGRIENCNLFIPIDRPEALQLVRDCYVDKIDESVLKGAYDKGGLIEVFKLLDPHSRYLNKEATDEENIFERSQRGFGGVGMELIYKDKEFRVKSVTPGTPASRENIKEDDVLLAVCQSDNDCLKIKTNNLKENEEGPYLSDVISKIRGKIGTVVILKFLRKGTESEIVVSLKRAAIKIDNVTSKIYGEFGYVRLRQFIENSDKDISGAISKMGALKGIILDLRGNPGGYLPQANRVSALFLPRTLLIERIVNRNKNELHYVAYYQSIFASYYKMPLVVLVDGLSASAAEIVAAACQDHGRCVVEGMPTFGKALVQTRYDFNGERIYLTTARIYRPNGKSLQGKGVIPDIIVNNRESESIESYMKEYREKFSERGLAGYLKGEEEDFTPAEKEKFTLLKNDRQLEMGLQILKILNLK